MNAIASIAKPSYEQLETHVAKLKQEIGVLRSGLKNIAELPYNEKDQDEFGGWIQLSDTDAHEYLEQAVKVALDTLSPVAIQKHADFGKIIFDMMSGIGKAQAHQAEINAFFKRED